MTQVHNCGDSGSFAAFFCGVAELCEDVNFVLRSNLNSSEFKFSGGHHHGHGYEYVILSFRNAMSLIVANEGGPKTPELRTEKNKENAKKHTSKSAASTKTSDPQAPVPRKPNTNITDVTGVLAVEVATCAAASALAQVACKLVAHAHRIAPQASSCFLTPKTLSAVSEISSNPQVGYETRRAGLNALRSILTECPPGVFDPDAVLQHVAVTMRERAGGALAATPPEGRRRDAFDHELAACINAVVDACAMEKTTDLSNETGNTRSSCDGALDQLVAAAVAVVEAGESNVSAGLRAAALRAVRASCLAKPAMASSLAPLFAHAGCDDVADTLVESMGRAFAWDKKKPDDAGGVINPRCDKKNDQDATVPKRRRLSVDGGATGHSAGVSNGRLGTTEDPLASFSGRAGGADDATLAWIEECVVSALSQLGPVAGGVNETDPSRVAPARAKASAGLARVAAALRRSRPRLAAAATTRDWMKWARRAHDAGDGAVAGAYAAVLRAADALSRRASGDEPDEIGNDRHVGGLGDEDLGAEGLLLWPWSVGADEAPAEFKREAKIAALRTALAAVASCAVPSATTKTAMKRTLQAGFHDADDAVRAAAACAAPASHLLLGLGGGALDARTPLGVVASVAEARGTSAFVRTAVATAVGGLAIAGAALGLSALVGRGGGSNRGAAANDAVLRALARDAGQRCVFAAGTSDATALAAAASAFDVALIEAVERAEADINERTASRAAAGHAARPRSTAAASKSAALPVADAARLLTTMLSLEEDAEVAAAALAAIPRVLCHGCRGVALGEALVGAAGLSSAATPLARHASAHVRAALLAAAPALASRGALLDAASLACGDAMDVDNRGVSGDDTREQCVKDAGLSLLQRLKSNVEDAADAATRESALRVFAAAAAAMPHSDCLDAALISMVHRLDDPDAGVRAAAVELVRAAATRKGVRPRELLLGNRLVAGHLGVKLPNAPGVLAVLSEALLRIPERAVLVELLPSAVPRLVERRDVETLKLYANKLGQEYDVATILHDWCYTAIADLINNSGARAPEEVQASMKFLTTHTGEALEVLVADHKKELMRALIRSAGADDAANPHDEAQRLGDVLGTLAKLAADGTASHGNDVSTSLAVHDFLRPHFTWLVMGDASDRSGDAAARRRFLRSLTIMVHLIGPHLPQFAPKVMAHLTSALERNSARLRKDALAAWLVVVKQLAKHAPDHLRRVAGRVVVAMLPHLPDGSSGGVGGSSSGVISGVGLVGKGVSRNGKKTSTPLDSDDDPSTVPNASVNAAAAAEVIDELVLRSGKDILCGVLARLPTLPNCERLARANAAVREERGEIPLVSLLQTLTDGLEDESQAVKATALGELRRALRLDPGEVSKLLNGADEVGSSGLLNSRTSTGGAGSGGGHHAATTTADVVGRLVAALLKCCVSENRTALSLRVQRLAAACLGELGAVDPGRIDLPIASTEKLSGAASGTELASTLLCEHIARTVRGAVDVDMLDAAAIAAQEILVHVECRPASVRAEDVLQADEGDATSARGSQDQHLRLPEGASKDGEAFWQGLPEEIRALLAPGLTSMYCLTREPAKPPSQRPLYKAPGGPSFRRWLYAWCRALASEATGNDAPVFAVCAAGVFKHDTRVMLFLLPRMVLDALAARDELRVQNIGAEITAVLRDAAGSTGGEGNTPGGGVFAHLTSPSSEQAELAAQAVFTLLDQLAAWKEDVLNSTDQPLKLGQQIHVVSKDDEHTIGILTGLLDSVPRELLARAALRCGAPARALLYFEDHLRHNKNVLNQSSLKHGEPEGGGLDDASASFLAATHRALAEPDALEAVARLRSRRGFGGGLSGSDALAAARRRAEDALLQHEQAGEWTEAMTHYESASRRGETLPIGNNGNNPHGDDSTQLDPAERGRLRCLQGLGHLRALEKETETLIASRPAARAELADMGAAAAWRLGEWDSLENFLDVLDASGAPADGAGGTSGVGGGDFSGRPGGEAAVGRVLLALHRRDADGVARAATAARDAVITPLAAAAMEGSYRRAHPAVVQLHLIREAEEAMEAVMTVDAKAGVTNGLLKSTAGGKRSRGSGGGARAVAEAFDGPLGIERLGDWDPRLELTPSAMATREPILALRRAAYAALGSSAEDASAYTWLAQAKLCRASGHAGAAQLALFEARAALEAASTRSTAGAASSGGDPSSRLKRSPAPGMALAVEQAKLLWSTGRTHRATVEIQEALDDSSLRGADPSATSRAMLRLARWSAATGQRSKTDVLNIYSNVLRDQRHTEKANFHVAKYMDDLLKDAKVRELRRGTSDDGKDKSRTNSRQKTFDIDERSLDYVVEVIQHYATSLRHGHRHAYESLPRMLTLWFDVGAAAAKSADANGSGTSNQGSRGQQQQRQNQPTLTSVQQKERKVALLATNSLKDFSQKLPLYTWLPALPQLTSRLCHPHAETRALIHELLYRLVKNFPNQVLWSMTAMARSTHVDRSTNAQRILDRAKDGAPSSARPLFEQSASLCDQLIRVCAFQPKPLPNNRSAKTFSIKAEFPALRRLTPCGVMVPGQAALTPSLPPGSLRNSANQNHVPTVSEWSAFPNDPATIYAIEDDVPVLASLQKPKKLTIIDSQGFEQSFLCKPKDDLRKDLRMMEFTTMLNRLLGRDASSRKRRLYLRTFAVIPLTEDCGLIEWVPSTTGLRHVIQKLYVDDGMYHKRTLVEVKEIHERLKATPTTWMSEILKKFPPVFHRWFLNRWKDRPAAWHGTRTAFAHTCAVWSMVGHVVGLGDRHGENILLDQESGDCLHVDFSCLFDKGLELETPEMVPFRCTQNIVDGLGAGGYEGVFMRASEITLGVLRNHREALMSVLETFVHDPLVEWSKAVKAGGGNGGRRGNDAYGQVEAERGKEALDRITARLEGVVVGVGSAPSLPLSPQGQARRLIEEATSRKSLGAMYIWWMAWM